MIKVNLLEDRSLQKKEDVAISYADAIKSQEKGGLIPAAGSTEIHPLVKVAILLVPALLVFLYEKRQKSNAQKIMARLIVDHQNVQDVKRQKEQQLQKSKSALNEIKVARPILDELKKIDYNRLVTIQALDNLQEILPFQVWLNSVEMDLEGVNMEGLAVSDNDLTQFLQALEASPYFINILNYKSTEETLAGSNYVGFRIRANLGDLGGG